MNLASRCQARQVAWRWSNILKLLGVLVLLAAWLLGALLLAAIFGAYGGMQVHLPPGVGQDGDLLV